MVAVSAIPAADVSHNLTHKLPVLRERLGAHSEHLISDDRLLTMLRITQGDLPEATLMALRYIMKTLRLQAERRDDHDGERGALIHHFGEMVTTLQAQHIAQKPTPPAKSRGWLPSFLKRD